MKPLVIYHTNAGTPCADGFGAAFAVWMKLRDNAEYLAMKHGEEIPLEVEIKDRDLFILDFSFEQEVMRDLFNYCSSVTWLDHHASVFKDWGREPNRFTSDYVDEAGLGIEDDKKYHKVILDNTHSGAMIAWEYFNPGLQIPMFIRHIDDYDRWQFKLDRTMEFNTALQARAPWNFEQWKELVMGDAHHELYLEGEVLLKAQAIQVASVIRSSATPCFFKIGNSLHEGLAANCPEHLRNEVSHELAKQSETFGMSWYQKTNGMIKVSLRSASNYDVLSLAKEYDGGGHKTAAGFEITMVTLQDLLCPF